MEQYSGHQTGQDRDRSARDGSRTTSQKFPRTAVRLNGMQVEEIRIGGTHTRVVFDKTSNATN